MLKLKIDVLVLLNRRGFDDNWLKQHGILSDKDLYSLSRYRVKNIKILDTICSLLDLQPGEVIAHQSDKVIQFGSREILEVFINDMMPYVKFRKLCRESKISDSVYNKILNDGLVDIIDLESTVRIMIRIFKYDYKDCDVCSVICYLTRIEPFINHLTISKKAGYNVGYELETITCKRGMVIISTIKSISPLFL